MASSIMARKSVARKAIHVILVRRYQEYDEEHREMLVFNLACSLTGRMNLKELCQWREELEKGKEENGCSNASADASGC